MNKYSVNLIVMSDTKTFISGNENNLCETKGSDKEFLKTCAKGMIEAFYTEEYYKNEDDIEHSLKDYVAQKVNDFGKITKIKFECNGDILHLHYYQ